MRYNRAYPRPAPERGCVEDQPQTASQHGVEIAFNSTQHSTFNFQPSANRGTLPDVLKVPPIPPTDTVAQASTPASSGSVSLPGATPVGTTGQPAPRTAALREEFALSNVAEIIGNFGGPDQLRNAINQLQSFWMRHNTIVPVQKQQCHNALAPNSEEPGGQGQAAEHAAIKPLSVEVHVMEEVFR